MRSNIKNLKGSRPDTPLSDYHFTQAGNLDWSASPFQTERHNK
jgi:hypothetical protein